MAVTSPVIVITREFLKSLRHHRWLVLACVAVCSGLAVAGVLTRSAVWTASQALLVRDEAVGQQDRPGRFDDSEAMKTAQETIQEMARNHEVVTAALRKVGPPAGYRHPERWPSRDDVDDAVDAINVRAPRGAEFGRTEVIYLSVKSHERNRAVMFATAVCDQLETRLQQVRNMKADSMFDELARSLELAETDLNQATQKLEVMEREIGSDLGQLRALNDSTAGDSSLQVTLNQIGNELRQAESERDIQQQLRRLLASAQENPDRLLAAPGRLFASQPGLKRLREGLVEAQLRMAELAGTMSHQHPRVLAAQEAEREVRADLHAELAVALRGVEAELSLSTTRLDLLRQQKLQVERRLDQLAGLRARYQNLVEDVTQRARIVDECKRDLADARASGASAESTSLISRLDEPLASNRPLGPSNAMILLAGVVGGVASGVGLVFLLTPMSYTRRRRWSDYLPFGRRATDRQATVSRSPVNRGRRATDRCPSEREVNYGRRATDVPQATKTPQADSAGTTRTSSNNREDGSLLLQCLTILERRSDEADA
jgi:uncharacterized protein involved in exopolysaccharide biosynthesis